MGLYQLSDEGLTPVDRTTFARERGGDYFEYRGVEGEIGDNALESTILDFELLKPFGVVGLRVANSALPSMPSRLGGLEKSADLAEVLFLVQKFVAFSELSDPLFGGVMPLLHSCLSFWLHSGASGLLVARDHLSRARADAP